MESVVCSGELPGPIEGTPMYPQGYTPSDKVIYEVHEIAVMKYDHTGLWVVGILDVNLSECVVK